jgi:hypothetical protein
MATPALLRRIALSLPQTEERSHHGHPDFRVCNKIFASLGYSGEDRGVVKLSLADQQVLLQSFPEVFERNGWSHQGWTTVHLKHVGASMLRQIVVDSWRKVAPPRLATAYEAQQAKAAQNPRKRSAKRAVPKAP